MGRAQYKRIARRAAVGAGINPTLFLRQMRQEANFSDQTSPAGAQGPAQIMPDTARGWGVKNVHDPVEAYNAAAKAMAKYLRSYGSWAKALTAYNAGPGAVGGALPAETQNYIKTILGGSDVRETPRAGASGGSPAGMRLINTVRDKNVFDEAGFEDARKKTILGQMIARRNPDSFLLRSGLLSTQAPAAGDFQKTKTVGGVKIMGTAAGGGGGRPAADAKGTALFEGTRVAAWIKPELEYARQHGWKGTINSGFRSNAEQRRIYNSGIRPAAVPGTSNHEGADFPRGAVDVTDAATLARILKRRGSPLKWAGAKDPVHFSHPHGGSY